MSATFNTLVTIEGTDRYTLLPVPCGSSIRQLLASVRLSENEPNLAHVWYKGAELCLDEPIDNYWNDGIPFSFTIAAVPPPPPCETVKQPPMQISVQCDRWHCQLVDVEPTDRIIDIKKKIEETYTFWHEEYRLFFGDTYLEDEKVPRDYSIEDGAYLRVIRRQKEELPLRSATTLTMPIFVRLPRGKEVFLTVKKTELIEDVKSHYQAKTGTPREGQLLFCRGMLLQDGHTLLDYRISDWAELLVMHYPLRLGPSGQIEFDDIEIVIETRTGSLFPLKVNPTARIRDVKAQIQVREDIPANGQYLVLLGEILQDEPTVIDYKIQNHDRIYAIPSRNAATGNLVIAVPMGPGKIVTYTVSQTDKIAYLLTLLRIEAGVPMHLGSLVFEGRMVDPEATFQDYPTTFLPTFHFVVRLRG
jgi:hypothetical protein